MREIKFRYRVVVGRSVCGKPCIHTYIFTLDQMEDTENEFTFVMEEYGNRILSRDQYTDLKDNTKWEDLTETERANWTRQGNLPSVWSGKEIYEGDKLEYSIDGHKQAVPYIIEDMTDWFEEMYNTDSYYRWDNQGKVIGNIYENPKLLEKP